MYKQIPLSLNRQSRLIDQTAEKNYGLSAEVLMEAAGAESAQEILSRFQPSSAVVLCGPGHNGGDGLAAARHLLSEGVSVRVLAPENLKSPLVKKQKERLEKQSINVHSIEHLQNAKEAVGAGSVVVDALFGSGLSKNIEGSFSELIHWINKNSKQKTVSLDIPSGLCADTGQVLGAAVQADVTLSFGLAKPGFYLNQGPLCTGELKVLSIGFPQKLLQKISNTHFLLSEKWVCQNMPLRKPDDHKAKQGRLLVLAGREGFWGAGLLCVLSAYRMGAGYVVWAGGDKKQNPPIDAVPDALTQKLSDPQLFSNKTAAAAGPGLGADERVKKVLLALSQLKIPAVIDADAFTLCVRENLFPLPSHWILTPHSGELARLFNVKGKDIDQDRCSYCLKASQKTGCIVLLKGFHSVISNGRECWIVPTGNSALAKAGTGDVLTGFIGALMARSLPPFTAGAAGAFIHGKLSDLWVQSGKSPCALTAQDLKELLPVLLNNFTKKSRQ